jgi:hypothetical protein
MIGMKVMHIVNDGVGKSLGRPQDAGTLSNSTCNLVTHFQI